VRTDYHPRQQVAEDHWLAQALEDDSRDRGRTKNEREVLQKRVRVVDRQMIAPSAAENEDVNVNRGSADLAPQSCVSAATESGEISRSPSG
jgi:hypothetical protein